MKNPMPAPEIPTILVVLGATGDLVKKKIIPSVCHLHGNRRLPARFGVVGMARRPMENNDFQKQVQTHLKERLPSVTDEQARETSALFSYHQGDFDDAQAFVRLKEKLDQMDLEWGVCSNKLFYLAVPPDRFETIFKNMVRVRLNIPCGGKLGWTRLLIEKPFGENLASAKKLFTQLEKYFKEEQLYLIDHYLAKEIVQAILSFRFSNNLFEKSWDKNSIEKIEIRLLETLGVEERGAFYDKVGAFQDVGQNHLLQMLAAITMDAPPCPMAAKDLRRRRAEVIEKLRPWSAPGIKKNTFRARYDGYPSIKGVSSGSNTETYFKLKTGLTHPRWQGVPVILESGKRCREAKKEVVVTFKHSNIKIPCAPDSPIHNRVVFGLEPEDRITIHFWTKKPGFEKVLEERDFNFFLYEHAQKIQYVEEYAELIFSCMTGDQTMFVSRQEIFAQWKFTDQVSAAWRKNAVPLARYAPGTDEMIKASASIGGAPEKEEVKELGIIGLGKMGANMARRMMDQGWRVTGYNRTLEVAAAMAKEGLKPVTSLKELVKKLPAKKIVWLMVPAGKPVDEMLFGKEGLVHYLKKGDLVIDGGNSFYKDALPRSKKLARYGIRFLDCGTSGGPGGARDGACLMIGGKRQDFEAAENLFRDFALPGAYQFFEGAGAGHFVKMIHNGIEYGMMQAIAEGFAILKKARFKLDLTRVSDIYNHGSVIESRLIGWLQEAFAIYGEDLKAISGTVGHSGEGTWTVETAREMSLNAKVIKEALLFRHRSAKNPDYTGQVVSALRGQFGGHPVLKKKTAKH